MYSAVIGALRASIQPNTQSHGLHPQVFTIQLDRQIQTQGGISHETQQTQILGFIKMSPFKFLKL